MKRTILILIVLALLAIPLAPLSRTAEANLIIPDIEVQINPGYLVLDVGEGGSATGQLACWFNNPTIHQVTVEATVAAEGFLITPSTLSFTLAGGSDLTIPIAVGATPWEARRAEVVMTAEIQRQDGAPGAQPKFVHASFIVAALPYGRSSIFPPEIHVPDKGWYQRSLTITSNASCSQYYDVSVTSDSEHFRVATTSSRIFLEGGDIMEYAVLVWCGKEGAKGEMEITLTPDYGNPETIRIALNKHASDLQQTDQGREGAPPVMEAGLLLALALFLVLARTGSSPTRRKLVGFVLVLFLVFAQFIILLPREGEAATMAPNPGFIPLSSDQLFYQFQLSIENEDANEKTYRLSITGHPYLFAYTREWMIPAQQSISVPVIFMKDYYQEQGNVNILIELEEIATEGVIILAGPGATTTSVRASSPGDDLFHGNLEDEDYLRTKGGDVEINIGLQVSLFLPGAELMTQDKESGSWEQVKELPLGLDPDENPQFFCNLKNNEIEKDQLYAIQLYTWENDSEPCQTIQLVFKGEDEDDGVLPGFELAAVLLIVGLVAVVHELGKQKKEQVS